jgi:protein-disulfide isomerase
MVAHRFNLYTKSMSKTFWAVIAIIVIIFGGVVVFSKKDSPSTDGSNNAQPTNHISGGGKSGVTLVEYGDFQCSACGAYYPLVKEVTEKYKDQIFFQFRNLPLLQVHKNAFAGARAAEAASNQGKFWEIYDLLYQNQTTWGESDTATKYFEQYATQLGLNMDQFKKDSASAEVNDRINADINEFKKTKEKMGTPTFFLDGKHITPKSVEDFNKLIDDAIAAKKQ